MPATRKRRPGWAKGQHKRENHGFSLSLGHLHEDRWGSMGHRQPSGVPCTQDKSSLPCSEATWWLPLPCLPCRTYLRPTCGRRQHPQKGLSRPSQRLSRAGLYRQPLQDFSPEVKHPGFRLLSPCLVVSTPPHTPRKSSPITKNPFCRSLLSFRVCDRDQHPPGLCPAVCVVPMAESKESAASPRLPMDHTTKLATQKHIPMSRVGHTEGKVSSFTQKTPLRRTSGDVNTPTPDLYQKVKQNTKQAQFPVGFPS